jgi:hypothetical protein
MVKKENKDFSKLRIAITHLNFLKNLFIFFYKNSSYHTAMYNNFASNLYAKIKNYFNTCKKKNVNNQIAIHNS